MRLRVIPESANLNRRHKAALFLTLLTAGGLLVWGASAKQTAGAVLIGLTFAWALGSNSRLVHLSLVILGLALALGPVVKGWYDLRNEMKMYCESVAEFERRIPDLAKQYPVRREGWEDSYVRLPDNTYVLIPIHAMPEELRQFQAKLA